MACAANRVIDMEGGCATVCGGEVIADVPLPIAGLMSDCTAEETALRDMKLRGAMTRLGVPDNSSPLMTMAFVSLAVIPSLKLTTLGYIDVNDQKQVSLYVAEKNADSVLGEGV